MQGEKSIVFSQWTGFMDLLEIALRRKNICFLRFDGKLQQKQRERVLKEFSESRDKLVTIGSYYFLSLKILRFIYVDIFKRWVLNK